MQNFIIASFATFYFAHAVVNTHGLFNLFDTLRTHLPHGGLLTCFTCSAFWLGLLAALVLGEPAVVGVGAAGVAVFLYRYSGGDMVK